MKGVKLKGSAGAKPSCLSWLEVLQEHRSRRGIAPDSLLVDGGEGGYANRFLADGRICYPGEGLKGHQHPTAGNRILLEALHTGHSFRVYQRQRPNCWQVLGSYRVSAVDYRLSAAEGRCIYWFELSPVGCVVGMNLC